MKRVTRTYKRMVTIVERDGKQEEIVTDVKTDISKIATSLGCKVVSSTIENLLYVMPEDEFLERATIVKKAKKAKKAKKEEE